MIVAQTPDQIRLVQLSVMKARLKLEIKGMKSSVNTANTVRRVIGSSTMNKVKLLEELEAYFVQAQIEYEEKCNSQTQILKP